MHRPILERISGTVDDVELFCVLHDVMALQETRVDHCVKILLTQFIQFGRILPWRGIHIQ
jgi:hypothetical protein